MKQPLAKARRVYGLQPSQTFTGLEAPLKEVQADAVLIVVPPEIHASVAEEALAHGLHA